MLRPIAVLSNQSASAVSISQADRSLVLLVEDDPEIRLVLSECLDDNGFSVVDTADAESAAEALYAGLMPSVVITDINLGPGDSGLDLAGKVHLLCPNTAIVFITGRLDMLRDRGLLPAEYVVPKPFPLSTLLTMVRKLGLGMLTQSLMSANLQR
jgi:CheY-like chemotaxis protein